jgi:hypothetical protein
MTDLEILTRAFLALPLEGRDNLLWHLDDDTQIFCGEGAENSYYSGRGFG